MRGGLFRYGRLYAHFLRFSFARTTQFRLDFAFRVLMDVVWNAHYLGMFALFAFHADTLGGFDVHQLRVFTGTIFVLDALQMTFVANGLWELPFAVNRGDLDYHLTRPVSSLFMVSLRDIAVSSSMNLLIAVGILVWALASYPHPLDAAAFAVYLALLPVALTIHWALHLMALSTAFWTQSTKGLRDVFWTSVDYAFRPVGVYPGWVRRILTTVIPVGVMVSFPCHVLFHGVDLGVVAHMVGVGAAAAAAAVFVWRRGLAVYGSASS